MMKRMESAIRSVVNKEMGLLKTLKAHHVPKGTLKEYVNRICKRVSNKIFSPLSNLEFCITF